MKYQEEKLDLVLAGIGDLKAGQSNLESGLKKLEVRITKVETRLKKVETRVSNIEVRFDRLEVGLERRFNKLEEEVGLNRTYNQEAFARISFQVDELIHLKKRVNTIENASKMRA
jgi:predicted nuclease with TOPRIM domain